MNKGTQYKLPKVIFIDWNKTLSNDLFWSKMSEKVHPYSKYYREIIQYLFVKNRKLVKPWMRGKYSSEDICEKISTAVELNKEVIFNELAISCKSMSFVSPAIPKLVKSIQSQGVKVVIATDNMDTFRRYTIPAMGLEHIFDDFLISYELKHLKNECEGNNLLFFSHYLKKNNLSLTDVVLLDDKDYSIVAYDNPMIKVIKINDTNKLLHSLSFYAA